MAEGAVEPVVGKLLSLLEREASLLGGVRHVFDNIKRQLDSMKAFLRDADRRSHNNEGVNEWVKQVRNVAYDVEDIIDEFTYHMDSQQKRGGFRGFLVATIHLPKHIWVKHQIATKLQKLNTDIKTISESSKSYGFDRIEEGGDSHEDLRWVRNHGESSLFIEDDDLVGFERESELLLKWLKDEQPQRTVISVVGMGGSGKTTLVAKAYKSQIVNRHFDSYAWITVSQTYAIDDLFRSMIRELFEPEMVPMDLSSMDYRKLVETLVNFLQPKRYVIVFDDVWDINLWDKVKVGLPNGTNGSRIILTTRNKDIASFSFGVGSHVHHLQPLGQIEAWALFCKRAFSSDPNRFCPTELEALARVLVGKCEGLPLAIVAIGGLMSNKDKTQLEWRKVYDTFNWELSNNPMLEVVKSILLLSYKDLPYYLKHCFLYCCIFPEDYILEREKLIKLWMAEGFVKDRRGMTPKEVADTYFWELVSRSMLLVAKRYGTRMIIECRMHDLMRELALSTSEKENFCTIYDGREARKEGKARRLSIHTSYKNIQLSTSLSQLRSLFVFVKDMTELPPGFRRLRVLDLEDVPIEKVPDEVVELFNLRYLNLRGTQVKELPKSLGRLRNLETLDISETKVESLPSGIVKLQTLQNLITSRIGSLDELPTFDYHKGTRAPTNVWKLKNLKVLYAIEANGEIVKQVGNMTQLTTIGITKVSEGDERELCASISRLHLLNTLGIAVTDEEKCLRMDALSSPPPLLQSLSLAGKLEKVPPWFHSLQNLTRLRLHWSRLPEDPLSYIHALPNLVLLYLVNAYDGRKLWFQAGFPKLKSLSLAYFPQLNDILIEKGVMPSIQELYLCSCVELKTLPVGIEYLSNLQLLKLWSASKELEERMQSGVDHPKVQHIPQILF
ncbi:hypothetical protein HHK36_032465 [Tetracentron sinense]|uniref:Disease resistance protein RPM1-like n=1 Tax=Tetracentron sinense TaxID=13715 RepID=A0A834Y950_TETSI|nr:hypothetical protein HHK36_032465 [Tetracentron sinense]